MTARPTPAFLDPSHPARHVPPEPGGEKSLGDYVRVLSSRWRLLVLLALGGALAGGTVSLLAKASYQAGVTLLVAEPKSAQQQSDVQTKDFEALIENNATASDTITKFGLDKAPYNLGPAEFLMRVARADQIGTTSLFRLSVRLPDAKLAADVANYMATEARELTLRLNRDQAEGARAQIAEQLADSRKRLDTVQSELEQVKREGQFDLLKRDVETLLTQRKDLRELGVKIAGERAWQATAAAELGKRQRIDVLTRSIDSDNALRESAREAGAKSVLGLSMKNEFVSSNYEDLDNRMVVSRATLDSLERQRDQLVKVSGLGADQLAKLTELYALETRVQRLEVDLELAKRVYLETASTYEQIRTLVASRGASLQIVDPAQVPGRPEPRNTARNAALGGLAALLVGFVVVLLRP